MRKIKTLLFDRRIDMVLMQETKRSSLNNLVARSLWPREKMEIMAVDAIGAAGGLLCIWDPDVFQLSECCSNKNFILLSGTILNSFECVILNVYAPNDIMRRGKLWESLLYLKSIFPKPWCLGGDFNEIRNLGERIGSSRRDRGMKEFNEFIDRWEVNDLPMVGRKFTWYNAHDGHKWSRIDRFLLSPEWIERYRYKLWGLPRLVSDHCPIVLMEDERDWGPKPFKFLNAWLLHPQFTSFVENTWKELQIQGIAGVILLRKLQALKMVLKQWNKEVYGNTAAQLKASEDKLNTLDLRAEVKPLEDAEIKQKSEARNEMWRLSRMLE
ncbi:uncharacterized protein LOC114287711 [Camellia sinensis]|uniref:uncharacterized protein LOC114287711 n=1 Tax=Camellia sinensis TaxID=4442 RepID=UPI00103600BB|nr:uncharacterized protein LOC114287711 [Camellia sinensis]